MPVHGAEFSEDERWVLTWSRRHHTVKVWDSGTGNLDTVIKHESFSHVRGAHFSLDGQWILSWTGSGFARVWDSHTGDPVSMPMKHDKDVLRAQYNEIIGAQFSRDQQRVLTWGEDGTARLWESSTGASLAEPMEHDKPVRGAQYSRDEQRIRPLSRSP